MNQRQPIISLNDLIKSLGQIIMNNGEMVSAVQQREQAIISSKATIDSLTQSLLARHNHLLGPNWTVPELTHAVIEEENINNLSVLIDTIDELSTYGATSEFFISTIRLLEQAGAWGLMG